MKTREILFSLKASKGESLAEDEEKRENSLRTKEDIGKGEKDREGEAIIGTTYNIGTHIRVGSLVSSRTREGHVFVTSFVNDETTY